MADKSKASDILLPTPAENFSRTMRQIHLKNNPKKGRRIKPLRIYWLVKGQADLKIGDKLDYENDEHGTDYDYMDEHFDMDKFTKDVQKELEIKSRLRKNMCNSIVYITNQSKTILGMMVINKREKENE